MSSIKVSDTGHCCLESGLVGGQGVLDIQKHPTFSGSGELYYLWNDAPVAMAKAARPKKGESISET